MDSYYHLLVFCQAKVIKKRVYHFSSAILTWDIKSSFADCGKILNSVPAGRDTRDAEGIREN